MAAAQFLRQRNVPERSSEKNEDSLLVFGYSCKLFRDDEKAISIDQERHLIPWMGDESLRIDRYDARGYLSDLTQYEAQPGSYRLDSLNEDELRVEELCQEERYLALRKDLNEEQMYHEEELKRLKAALAADGSYHEISFSYENVEGAVAGDGAFDDTKDEDVDEPYQLPPGLVVPAGMQLPSNMKIHTIIEKTAVFVSQQGSQMEIIIKTKQSNNPQFNFLAFDNPLNPYYKHLVTCIRGGKYQPQPQREKYRESISDDDDDEGHYLHPSLFAGKPPDPPPITVPTALFRRGNEDDSYSRLVRNLGKLTANSSSACISLPRAPHPPGSKSVYPLEPPPLPPFMEASSYYGSYPTTAPPPPGLEPVTLPDANQVASGTQLPASSELASSMQLANENDWLEDDPHKKDNTQGKEIINPPPPDIQPIIDKMAVYVAKNGEDFETIVKSKDDARFAFLYPWHEHYPYYASRKQFHTEQKVKEAEKASVKLVSSTKVEEPKEEETKPEKIEKQLPSTPPTLAVEKGVKCPVSFSIKMKAKEAESTSLEKKKKKKKSALLLDESDSETEEGRERKERGGGEGGRGTDSGDNERMDGSSPQGGTGDSTPAEEDKPKKLTPEEMEARLAGERLKDKLAAAARERLVHQSKERQLQQERKKRATMFLNMLKKVQPSKNNVDGSQLEPSVQGPQPDPTKAQLSPLTHAITSPIIQKSENSNVRCSPMVSLPTSPWSGSSSSSNHELDGTTAKPVHSDPVVLPFSGTLSTTRSSELRYRKLFKARSKSKKRSRSRSASNPGASKHRHHHHHHHHPQAHHHVAKDHAKYFHDFRKHSMPKFRTRSLIGDFVKSKLRTKHKVLHGFFSRSRSKSRSPSKKGKTLPASYAIPRRSRSRSPVDKHQPKSFQSRSRERARKK